MAYKIIGIKNSTKEGWYHSDSEHPECHTSRAEVETPLGTIIAEVSSDEAYPGVWLSFRINGDTYEKTVALLEAENDEMVALKVWSDEPSNDDWDHRFVVCQKES